MTTRIYPTACAPARHRHQRRLTRRSLWLFVRRFRWHLVAIGYLVALLWAGVQWTRVMPVWPS